jgi:hypothetical protein
LESGNNICPLCKSLNRDINRFCTQCGFKLFADNTDKGCLTILSGKGIGASIALDGDRNILGRENKNGISIDDEQISKQHAAIRYENDFYWIEDLQSKNGVYLNGKRIVEPERLYNGTLIKMGTTLLKFELN